MARLSTLGPADAVEGAALISENVECEGLVLDAGTSYFIDYRPFIDDNDTVATHLYAVVDERDLIMTAVPMSFEVASNPGLVVPHVCTGVRTDCYRTRNIAGVWRATTGDFFNVRTVVEDSRGWPVVTLALRSEGIGVAFIGINFGENGQGQTLLTDGTSATERDRLSVYLRRIMRNLFGYPIEVIHGSEEVDGEFPQSFLGTGCLDGSTEVGDSCVCLPGSYGTDCSKRRIAVVDMSPSYTSSSVFQPTDASSGSFESIIEGVMGTATYTNYQSANVRPYDYHRVHNSVMRGSPVADATSGPIVNTEPTYTTVSIPEGLVERYNTIILLYRGYAEDLASVGTLGRDDEWVNRTVIVVVDFEGCDADGALTPVLDTILLRTSGQIVTGRVICNAGPFSVDTVNATYEALVESASGRVSDVALAPDVSSGQWVWDSHDEYIVVTGGSLSGATLPFLAAYHSSDPSDHRVVVVGQGTAGGSLVASQVTFWRDLVSSVARLCPLPYLHDANVTMSCGGCPTGHHIPDNTWYPTMASGLCVDGTPLPAFCGVESGATCTVTATCGIRCFVNGTETETNSGPYPDGVPVSCVDTTVPSYDGSCVIADFAGGATVTTVDHGVVQTPWVGREIPSVCLISSTCVVLVDDYGLTNCYFSSEPIYNGDGIPVGCVNSASGEAVGCPLGFAPGEFACESCGEHAVQIQVLSGAAGQCTECEGYEIPNEDQTACDECPINTVYRAFDRGCAACFPGTYRAVGAMECVGCPQGFFCPDWTAVNETEPIACSSETVSFGGAAFCGPCEVGFERTSSSFCSPCNLGFFSADGVVCEPCPLGFYSAVVGSDSCRRCPGDNCLGGGVCREGYTEVLCQVCADDYYMSSGVCTQCPALPWPLIGVGVVIVLGAIIASRVSISEVILNQLTFVVDHIQLMSIAYSYYTFQPTFLRQTYDNSLRYLDLSFEALQIDCLRNEATVFSVQFRDAVLFPAVLVALYFAISWTFKLRVVYLITQRLRGVALERVQVSATESVRRLMGYSAKAQNVTLTLLLLFHAPLTESVANALVCFRSDQVYLLTVEQSTVCTSTSHSLVVIVAVFLGIYVVIGAPLLLGSTLLRLRNLGILWSPNIREAFGGVYGKYREKYIWMESVFVLRKALLIIVGALLTSQSLLIRAIPLVILVVAYGLFVLIGAPYVAVRTRILVFDVDMYNFLGKISTAVTVFNFVLVLVNDIIASAADSIRVVMMVVLLGSNAVVIVIMVIVRYKPMTLNLLLDVKKGVPPNLQSRCIALSQPGDPLPSRRVLEVKDASEKLRVALRASPMFKFLVKETGKGDGMNTTLLDSTLTKGQLDAYSQAEDLAKKEGSKGEGDDDDENESSSKGGKRFGLKRSRSRGSLAEFDLSRLHSKFKRSQAEDRESEESGDRASEQREIVAHANQSALAVTAPPNRGDVTLSTDSITLGVRGVSGAASEVSLDGYDEEAARTSPSDEDAKSTRSESGEKDGSRSGTMKGDAAKKGGATKKRGKRKRKKFELDLPLHHPMIEAMRSVGEAVRQHREVAFNELVNVVEVRIADRREALKSELQRQIGRRGQLIDLFKFKKEQKERKGLKRIKEVVGERSGLIREIETQMALLQPFDWVKELEVEHVVTAFVDAFMESVLVRNRVVELLFVAQQFEAASRAIRSVVYYGSDLIHILFALQTFLLNRGGFTNALVVQGRISILALELRQLYEDLGADSKWRCMSSLAAETLHVGHFLIFESNVELDIVRQALAQDIKDEAIDLVKRVLSDSLERLGLIRYLAHTRSFQGATDEHESLMKDLGKHYKHMLSVCRQLAWMDEGRLAEQLLHVMTSVVTMPRRFRAFCGVHGKLIDDSINDAVIVVAVEGLPQVSVEGSYHRRWAKRFLKDVRKLHSAQFEKGRIHMAAVEQFHELLWKRFDICLRGCLFAMAKKWYTMGVELRNALRSDYPNMVSSLVRDFAKDMDHLPPDRYGATIYRMSTAAMEVANPVNGIIDVKFNIDIAFREQAERDEWTHIVDHCKDKLYNAPFFHPHALGQRYQPYAAPFAEVCRSYPLPMRKQHTIVLPLEGLVTNLDVHIPTLRSDATRGVEYAKLKPDLKALSLYLCGAYREDELKIEAVAPKPPVERGISMKLDLMFDFQSAVRSQRFNLGLKSPVAVTGTEGQVSGTGKFSKVLDELDGRGEQREQAAVARRSMAALSGTYLPNASTSSVGRPPALLSRYASCGQCVGRGIWWGV